MAADLVVSGLRIHDETERGDNETIKMAGEKMKEKAAQR